MSFERAYQTLMEKLSAWASGLVEMLPNIVLGLLVFVVSYGVGRLAQKAVDRVIARLDVQETARKLLARLALVGVMAIGFAIALTIMHLGEAAASLLAGAGIIGLALGFAFQDLASNFISGVGLSFRRPMRIGDLVETHDTFGVVEEIELRTTTLRTPQGEKVLIPNKLIFQERLINYSDSGTRRVDLDCGVSYGDDLEKVREVAIGALEAVEHRIPDREVELFFTGFGDSSIDFVARIWIEARQQKRFMEAQSDAVIRLKKAFDENDINIPWPIRTLDFGIKGGEKLDAMLRSSRPISESTSGRDRRES